MLRAAVGVASMTQGAAYLGVNGPSAAGTTLAGAVAMLCGVALLVGFLTPVASGFVTLGTAAIAFSWSPLSAQNYFATKPTAAFVAVVATAVILLGPGAISFDARLFGRREIIIPHARRSPQP